MKTLKEKHLILFAFAQIMDTICKWNIFGEKLLGESKGYAWEWGFGGKWKGEEFFFCLNLRVIW